MKLIDLNINDFTKELASSSPAPGGGSIAALCATLGAALCQMVSNLTIGKKKYADAQDFMLEVKEKSETLTARLLELVDKDTASYNRVVDAYKLPKETIAQVQLRKKSIEDALKAAADIPFQTLGQAAETMVLVEAVIARGNANCITDAGVAAELINTAVRGAAYNVFINLLDINNKAFASDLKAKTSQTLENIQQRCDAIRKTLANAIEMES